MSPGDKGRFPEQRGLCCSLMWENHSSPVDPSMALPAAAVNKGLDLRGTGRPRSWEQDRRGNELFTVF